MVRFLALLALGAVFSTAATGRTTQGPPAPSVDPWTVSDQAIVPVPANIAFPRSAGVLNAYQNLEFSHQGEGIDNAIQYRSADGAIFGTIYIYYPGLAHSGLAAFATDYVIRTRPNTHVTRGELALVSAGGIQRIAIRRDYSGYINGMATSAAFIKVDRWMIKFRVSGPESRRPEIDAAMSALLAEVRFGAGSIPRPPDLIRVHRCPTGSAQRSATLLQDPPGPEIATHALLATFDGGGMSALNNGARVNLPSRIPEQLCLSTIINERPILRADPGQSLSVDGRTLLLVIVSDSGETLEVVYVANLGRYHLLHHRMGETILLGSFDGVPSDQQIAEIFEDPNAAAARPRVPVRFRPGQGHHITLPAPASTGQEAAPPAT